MLGHVLFAAVLQASASPADAIQLDLATLEPGPVHRIAVTAERPFKAILVNRLPGARYSLSTMTHPIGTTDYLQPNVADQDAWLRTWRPEAGCLDLAPPIRAVLEAGDEQRLAALLAQGGDVEHALSQTQCTMARVVRERLFSVVRRPATSSGPLDLGEALDFTIERLDASSAPIRTWHVRFEARTLPPLAWSSPSELAWIARQIALDLSETTALMLERTPGDPHVDVSCGASPGAGCALTVRFQGAAPKGGETLSLGDSVWSPKAWAPVVNALLGGRRPKHARQAVAETASAVDALTDPQAAVMESENQRLSAWLEREIASPEAHEQAALLLTALALREAAGPFSDVRTTLARATAHLAIALALRGGTAPSPAGSLADVARLVLIGRQRDALSSIDAMAIRSTSERAWTNALRLRATGDWRLLEKPLLASLLERREHYRALEQSLGDQHALAFLDERNSEPSPDWGRILISSKPSVQAGNSFLPATLGMELAEAADVYRRVTGSPAAASKLIALLNEPPGRFVAVDASAKRQTRVIDWGTWARFYQRHVVNALIQADYHERTMLALTEKADAHWTERRALLAGLELLPLASVYVAGSQAAGNGVQKPPNAYALEESACGAVAEMVETQPQRLTASNWRRLLGTCHRGGAGYPWGQERWFGDGLPPGTAFDAEARLPLLSVSAPATLEPLQRVAPYNRAVLDRLDAHRHPDKETPAEFDAIYGRLGEYDLKVMRRRAALVEDDVEAYKRAFASIVRLDADSWIELGDYLVSHDREDEAAAAFRRANADALDRLWLSNSVEFLVDYLVDRGEKDEASALAREAAETYSGAGLGTMARLQERLGAYDAAERYFKQQAARYPGSATELDGFYVRYELRVGDGRYAEAAREARARLFPAGLERPARLPAANPSGVRVVRCSDRFERMGLRKGDIIVAIDGYRVQSAPQYRCLRRAADGSTAAVTVWRDGKYTDAKAPRRGLSGLSFESFPKP